MKQSGGRWTSEASPRTHEDRSNNPQIEDQVVYDGVVVVVETVANRLSPAGPWHKQLRHSFRL